MGTHIVSFSRHTQPKERDPDKIFNLFLLIADELNALVCMRRGGGGPQKKRYLLHETHFLPVLVPVMAEVALCAIASVNKAFTALFLFKLFPGKPTGSSFWV